MFRPFPLFNAIFHTAFVIIILLFNPYYYNLSFSPAVGMMTNDDDKEEIMINDDTLTVQVVASGLRSPTAIDFLGPNDILVLEKNAGTVQRIINGTIFPEPLLDVNVANKRERGMLGIAVSKDNTNGSSYVFLYYTEAIIEGSDICPTTSYCLPGNDPLGNRLYRYKLINNNTKLADPKMLLDLPAGPAPSHNGGKMIIGPDSNIYFTIGDKSHKSITQNYPKSLKHNGTSAIYRISQDGKTVGKGIIINDTHNLDKYYAYGIRNSFGIDFDPLTGKLWDTENGPAFGDEINLVEPGFNSGWRKMQGFWETNGTSYKGKLVLNSSEIEQKVRLNPRGLVDFGGKGKYSSPEFAWFNVVGPTAIKFLDSANLGKQYQNDMFVGDFNNGNIYHFELNRDRTALALDGPLSDKIADTPSEIQGKKFAGGFAGITDMKVGPDGFLYVVSIAKGKIYKIFPKAQSDLF